MKTDASDKLNKDLRRIAGMVANFPDADPPDTLVGSVMGRIQPKTSSGWQRLWRRLQIPIPVTPVRFAPLAAAALVLVLALVPFLGRSPETGGVATVDIWADKPGKAVMFMLDMPEAERVEVIGSFNQRA